MVAARRAAVRRRSAACARTRCRCPRRGGEAWWSSTTLYSGRRRHGLGLAPWVPPHAPGCQWLDAAPLQRLLHALTCRTGCHALTVWCWRVVLSCPAPHAQQDRYAPTGDLLGKGGFSVVLAVTERSSNTRFAAKRVLPPCPPFSAPDAPSPPRCVSADGTHRLAVLRGALAEASVLARLRHPGVVGLWDVVCEPKRCCLLLEACSGGTLLSVVQARVAGAKARRAARADAPRGALRDPTSVPYSLSEPEARAAVRHAAAALRYVHAKGFVHRDVKLENLLLARPGDLRTLRLADFGFACRAQRDGEPPPASPATATGARPLTGTLEYAAPEIIAAYRRAGRGAEAAAARPPVDLYSLGCVLFLLVGGYHLFDYRAAVRDGEAAEKAGRADARAALEAEFVRTPVWGVSSSQLRHTLRGLLSPTPAGRPTAEGVLSSEWMKGDEEPLLRGEWGFAATASAAAGPRPRAPSPPQRARSTSPVRRVSGPRTRISTPGLDD